jgi:hypothetical protein
MLALQTRILQKIISVLPQDGDFARILSIEEIAVIREVVVEFSGQVAIGNLRNFCYQIHFLFQQAFYMRSVLNARYGWPATRVFGISILESLWIMLSLSNGTISRATFADYFAQVSNVRVINRYVFHESVSCESV